MAWSAERSWRHYAANLVTVIVLVVFLGINVSEVGLVEFANNSPYFVAELFGLILATNVVCVAAFVALEWKSLTKE